MGMTTNQLQLVRAVGENKLEEAKRYALACCAEDDTKKNEYYVKKYRNILQNNPTMIELPQNIKGMAQMEDVTSFREDRYYLSARESALFQKISDMNKAGLRLMELGIPYVNAILLTGESGTGKTTYGRYVAHKLELPFLYINFSYLVDSYMGGTSKNLRNVFDFARTTKCLLMLDEIDCIAQSRKGGSEGSTREHNNTTISLLQELDKIQNDSIIIGATNIPDAIDLAVKRRFSVHHEVKPMTVEECTEMMSQYLQSVGIEYDDEEVPVTAEQLCKGTKMAVQASVLNFLTTKIADAVIHKRESVVLT